MCRCAVIKGLGQMYCALWPVDTVRCGQLVGLAGVPHCCIPPLPSQQALPVLAHLKGTR